MQERIIKLLKLCLQAQEKKAFVTFNSTPVGIFVFHHDPDNDNIIAAFVMYYNNDFDNEYKKAEMYLKELIHECTYQTT